MGFRVSVLWRLISADSFRVQRSNRFNIVDDGDLDIAA